MTDLALRAKLRKGGIERAADFHFDTLASERIAAIRETLNRKHPPEMVAKAAVADEGVRGR